MRLTQDHRFGRASLLRVGQCPIGPIFALGGNMIPADETFDGTFPFKPHFTNAPGFRMHYVDEGEGDPIVCLHGEPTWAYLYRNFIPPLSKRHRVIVPDHMGFGRSETPVDRE